MTIEVLIFVNLNTKRCQSSLLLPPPSELQMLEDKIFVNEGNYISELFHQRRAQEQLRCSFPRIQTNIMWKNSVFVLCLYMGACIGDAYNNSNSDTLFTAGFCKVFITIFLTKKGFWLEFVMFYFFPPDSCPGCSVTNISNPRIIACTCSGKMRRVPRLLPITET